MATKIRRPEYTGTNRCLPCTVLNAIIAAGVASLLFVVVDPRLGVLSFVAFAVTIYVRGYLVPGTPTITKTYAPEVLLRPFGFGEHEHPPIERSPTAANLMDSNARGVLSTTGVVSESDSDARLTTDFRSGWRDRMRSIRKRELDRADVLELFDADTVSDQGRLSFVIDKHTLRRWESEAALIADIAAADELRSRSAEWSEFDIPKRTEIFTGVRLLLQHCPACDGPLSMTTDRADPCCRKPYTVAESVCRECGDTVAAVSVPGRHSSIDAVFCALIAEQSD